MSEADLTSRVAVVRKVGYERDKSHAAIDLIVEPSRTRSGTNRAVLCSPPPLILSLAIIVIYSIFFAMICLV